MGNITDFSKYKLIDIKKCVKADWNYKQENEELTKKLVENLKRNGQVENILVRELETGFYEVVNGNHRLDAMLQIGAPKIIVYDLGKISLAEAKRITVETNETKFVSDQVKLAEVMHELSQHYTMEDLSASLPYSQQELDNYIKMHTFSMEDFAKQEAQSSGEHGVSAKPENVLSFQMADDTLNLWKDVIAILKEAVPDASDYDYFCFVLSLSASQLGALPKNFKLNGFEDVQALIDLNEQED